MIKITRQGFEHDRTHGTISDGNMVYTPTLEDAVRPYGLKIPDVTAIPAGIYTLVERYSPAFEQNMLCLVSIGGKHDYRVDNGDAPFFYIYLHGGTRPEHSSGCILMPGWGSKGIYDALKHQIGKTVHVINDFAELL